MSFGTNAKPNALSVVTAGPAGFRPVCLEFTAGGNPKIFKGPIFVTLGIDPYLYPPTGDSVNTYHGVKVSDPNTVSSSYVTVGPSFGMGGGQVISCRSAPTDSNNLVIDFPDWWGLFFPEDASFGILCGRDDGTTVEEDLSIATTIWFKE